MPSGYEIPPYNQNQPTIFTTTYKAQLNRAERCRNEMHVTKLCLKTLDDHDKKFNNKA